MTGMIHFKCSKCGTRVRVPREMAGKKGRCPKCQTVFPIPGNAQGGEQPDAKSEPTDKVEVFDLQVSSSLDQLAAVMGKDPDANPAHQYQVPAGSQAQQHAAPPPYNAMKGLAGALQVVGVFCWMAALCLGIYMFAGEVKDRFMLGVLLGITAVLGVLCYALGEAFNCIRDIARNTFKH
ncbi:MAG: hypothetical protein HZA50_07645 [Planctomycetes bacterium]|nr:hypothetical protein [Planctomycetota bacterium]